MPCSKPISLLLAFVCFQFIAAAQKAKYTELYKEYDLTIAGYIKNSIHTWSATTAQSRFQNNRPTTLILHVYSPGMQLLKENSVTLGKIRVWNIDFLYEDTCYYANIVYLADIQKKPVRKNIILKIDPDGNSTDVTSTHGPWKKVITQEDKNRFYATTRVNNNLFIAVSESAAATDSVEAGDFIHLPGEKIGGVTVLEKLIVRKIDIPSRDWTFQVFGSPSHKFHHPLISVRDSTVIVTAIAEKNEIVKKDKNNNGPLLFFARLDTSLTDSGTKFAMLKNTSGNKNETYLPFQLVSIKNKALLLSRGMYLTETVFFTPGNRGYGQTQMPRVIRNLVTNSLKITLVNDQNKMLRDTVIEKKYGSMEWENFFMITSPTRVDLFCSRKYTGNKNGITHFSINEAGEIMEEDMIVSVQYEYNMNRAKNPAPGVLLVPFTRRDKTGLMRLDYTTAE